MRLRMNKYKENKTKRLQRYVNIKELRKYTTNISYERNYKTHYSE